MKANASGYGRQNCRQSTDSGTSTTMKSTSELGAPEGIRTPNLLIRSQMLYPLSYGLLFSVMYAADESAQRRREDLNLRSALRRTTH